MQQAARIAATIELLDKAAAAPIPMDGVTGDYMRARRYIGSKDRADIAARIYDMTRAHARLGWWLARTHARDKARQRAIAWLCLGEKLAASQVENLFNSGAEHGPGALSSDEVEMIHTLAGQDLNHPDMPDAVRVECPPELEPALRAAFGDNFVVEMEALLHGAPLDLRVNQGRADKDKVISSLAADHITAQDTPYCPWALRLTDKAFLSKTKAFGKGWVEIQDEGSQLIAYICAVQPGMQVLDYCAGGGGKTLALAAAMNNKGRLVAMDIDAGRLAKAKQRLRRAFVTDMIEIRPLSDEKNRKWLRRQKETFDVTLIDAPCSGTGTWRRNPDQRWRQFGPSLDELVTTQAEILARTAKTIKPGGRLVYATCSLLPAENEDQIAQFLAHNPEFEVMPLPAAWPSDATPAPGPGPYMRLTPHKNGTDGFFAAVLTKRA